MGKAVSAKFSAVSDMNRLQLEYSNHTHRSNERLRDTMAHNRAGLGRTLIGNMSQTSKFRDYTNTELLKHNWDPFKVQTSDSHETMRACVRGDLAEPARGAVL